jgi:glycogen debranching enzyme
VGSVIEDFADNPPYMPHGCFAQAWSMAEVLHVWHSTEK